MYLFEVSKSTYLISYRFKVSFKFANGTLPLLIDLLNAILLRNYYNLTTRNAIVGLVGCMKI